MLMETTDMAGTDSVDKNYGMVVVVKYQVILYRNSFRKLLWLVMLVS